MRVRRFSDRDRPTGVWLARLCAATSALYLMMMVLLMPVGQVLAENPCVDCHEDVAAVLTATSHWQVVARSAAICETCHGDGTQHLETFEAADIRVGTDLQAWDADRQAQACLTCHAAKFPNWDQQAHAGEVSCWDCHASEGLHWQTESLAEPRTAVQRGGWNLCTGCHQTVRAEFSFQYRHPVERGTVRCVDCHDIHGRDLPLNVSQGRDVCVRCHEEQSGPYLFEHPALDQGCASCHRPHGSWNRDLLTTVGNGVCLDCHLQSNFAAVGNTPHDFLLSGGARCWDCHSEIHGSNTTPDFNPRGRR